MLNVDFAERVKKLPPYIFTEMEKITREKKLAGVDMVSLSIGDPDLLPPQFILDALKEEAANPSNHGYSTSRGEPEFRETVTDWLKNRFKIDVNPKTEVATLIGSKEGIANIARAFINPGDHVLVPNPAYPVYANGGAILNDGIPVSMPLLEDNNFLPDFAAIASLKAKMMFLNYPSNPTGAVSSKRFLQEAVDFALENNIILCYDNAYSEITYDGYKAPSILEADGGMDIAIEFHSFSKTFNMTGYRIAFAVGNSKLVDGLVKVKSQVDSGPPKYMQHVAMRGLNMYRGGEPPDEIKKVNATYQHRAKVLMNRLQAIGLEYTVPKASFYVWVKCGGDSLEFARKLVDVGVVVTPGVGFGEYGEGYVRFSLTKPVEDIEEACDRIAKIKI